jgi:hypothetical protein
VWDLGFHLIGYEISRVVEEKDGKPMGGATPKCLNNNGARKPFNAC